MRRTLLLALFVATDAAAGLWQITITGPAISSAAVAVTETARYIYDPAALLYSSSPTESSAIGPIVSVQYSGLAIGGGPGGVISSVDNFFSFDGWEWRIGGTRGYGYPFGPEFLVSPFAAQARSDLLLDPVYFMRGGEADWRWAATSLDDRFAYISVSPVDAPGTLALLALGLAALLLGRRRI